VDEVCDDWKRMLACAIFSRATEMILRPGFCGVGSGVLAGGVGAVGPFCVVGIDFLQNIEDTKPSHFMN
jgi:hypothetical protein